MKITLYMYVELYNNLS